MSIMNIQREEARDVWDRIKKEYDECTACKLITSLANNLKNLFLFFIL